MFFGAISVYSKTEIEVNLSDFYQKQEKASKMLKEIEADLKDGSRDRVCKRQKKAASYGIEATQSLIKALKANSSETDIKYLQKGLDKWTELRDNCY